MGDTTCLMHIKALHLVLILTVTLPQYASVNNSSWRMYFNCKNNSIYNTEGVWNCTMDYTTFSSSTIRPRIHLVTLSLVHLVTLSLVLNFFIVLLQCWLPLHLTYCCWLYRCMKRSAFKSVKAARQKEKMILIGLGQKRCMRSCIQIS